MFGVYLHVKLNCACMSTRYTDKKPNSGIHWFIPFGRKQALRLYDIKTNIPGQCDPNGLWVRKCEVVDGSMAILLSWHI